MANFNSRQELCLSAVEIFIEQDELLGKLSLYENSEVFAQLRDEPSVFAYRLRHRNEVLVVDLGKPSDGSEKRIESKHFLSAIARLIETQLPQRLPELELEPRWRGLARVRRHDDLVAKSFQKAGIQQPQELQGFHKFHKTIFQVRHDFFPGRRGKVLMLTVEFRRHQEISSTVSELVSQGVHVQGLQAFGVSTSQDRGWLGCIKAVEGDRVQVESDEGLRWFDGSHVELEASTETFASIFAQVLGRSRQEQVTTAEWQLLAADLGGIGHVERLQSVRKHLQKAGTLDIAPGLQVRFGDVVTLSTQGREPDARVLPQVEYCFSRDRTALDRLPAQGLQKHGPLDASSFDTKEPRLLVVCPAETQNQTETFVKALRDGLGKAFAGGFVGLYRLNKLGVHFAPVPLEAAGRAVGSAYEEVLQNELALRKAPDLALVVIRDQDAFSEVDNPYLTAKGFLLRQGIPSQQVRISKLQSRPNDLQYILRDMALAMYAKLGGTPWTVTPSTPLAHEVVIGMAHAEFGRRHSEKTRYMGIATVFTGEGNYLLASGTPRCKYEDYADHLVECVKTTLLRLATDYGWGVGDVVRLVFHSTKPLTGNETARLADEAVAALDPGIQVQSAFLTIESDHPYKVIAPSEKGRESFVDLLSGRRGKAVVGECAPVRGLVVDLGRSKRLLCVNGPSQMKREGETIPHPLQITLHRESNYTDLGALARQVFHFTGLSWRSMLPIAEPVTLAYPRLVAKHLGRLSKLPNWSDDLLDTRLRRSRWFL